ncbi:MAG: hypothetical protein methR_P1661 [Methyloprofundus sp.]|nr:MAG: hypothetical protein methR_P1661 [Methyloprofundus sp.]
MLKRIHHHTMHGLFWLLLVSAIGTSALHFAMTKLNVFKPDLEAQLADYLGTQVNISSVSGAFNGFKPELVLHDIKVQAVATSATAIHLQEVHVGLSLLTAMRHSLLKALQVTLIGAKLEIKRLATGGIAITGLPSDDSEQPTWLMQGKQYELIDSEILWLDEKRNAQPIELKHVNIFIHNNSRHKIFISMDLPDSLGESLRLAMDFTGSMFEPNSVNARLFIEGKQINLAKIITGDLPFDFSFTQGHGDFSIWSTWQAAEMTQMSGNVRIQDVAITDQQQKQHFPVDVLELQFKLRKLAKQWQLAIQNMAFSSQNARLAISQLALALKHNSAGELTHIALNCPHLNLGRLREIITLNKVLPEELQNTLHKLALQGEIKDLLFLADIPQQTFAINGELNDLQYQAFADIPGIKGLNLHIKGNESQGNIVINSQQLSFDSPDQFRKPLNIHYILGLLQWQQESDAWLLSSPMLELQTADIKVKNKFQLTLPKNEQATSLNLHTHFYDGRDAAQVPPYLPVGLLSDDALIDWLDHAFLAGTVEQGDVLFRGALTDYPFTKSEGVIEVLFAAQDVNLHYAPDWPNLENLNAEIRFFSESLAVNITDGNAFGVHIEQAAVSIDSFTHSDYLVITGDIKGKLSQATQFLEHSPLQKQASAVNKLCKIQGSFAANLDLKIPLSELPGQTHIIAQTNAATLNLNSAEVSITDIDANIHFSEKGTFSETITAQAFGSLITAKIDSNELNTSILISGQADTPLLKKHFPHSFWNYLHGSSPYQILLNIPTDTQDSTHIQLTSDLVGVAIDFPPLSKPALQKHPLELSSSISSSGIDSFSLSYIDLVTADNNLVINLQRINSYWQGKFTSPIANGSAMLPTKFNKMTQLKLSFDNLNLSALQQLEFKDNLNSSDSATLQLNDFPSMTIKSNALYWQSVNLGVLDIQTQAAHDGLFIKQFHITSATEQLELSGHWRQQATQETTIIEGQLLSQNFGHLLQSMQLSNTLVGSSTELQFALHWLAPPYEFSKSLLSGSVNAYLTNGRILGVDPGIGRILGALDVSKLGKRLRLDFSDITEAGLSFTEITAKLNLNQGLIKTNKSHINAMPAEIFITGSTDLNTEQIDIQATVLPKVPIAGTIIGNAANVVTKTFIGDEYAGGLLLSLLYNIKGTWDNFQVERQFNQALPSRPQSKK